MFQIGNLLWFAIFKLWLGRHNHMLYNSNCGLVGFTPLEQKTSLLWNSLRFFQSALLSLESVMHPIWPRTSAEKWSDKPSYLKCMTSISIFPILGSLQNSGQEVGTLKGSCCESCRENARISETNFRKEAVYTQPWGICCRTTWGNCTKRERAQSTHPRV